MDLIRKLPVFQEFEKIQNAWDQYRHIILKSPTGSGKSIALPYLLKASQLVSGKILVIQPRRIAARVLAHQVASFAKWKVGQEVGYQVRFDKKYSEDTQIIYATDGVVLNKLLSKEGLLGVDVLILDEFHERSAQLDLCLSLALKMCQLPSVSLRLILTSATLNLDALAQFIPSSVSLEIKGRSFPVQIEHKRISHQMPVWKSAVQMIPSLMKQFDGDILVFLDGAFEIAQAVKAILRSPWSSGVLVRPLYGELSPENQDLALAATNQRKIIVSTNIAETSLTIEGVKVVIDSGKAKRMRYDSKRGINVLLSEPISKSSAEQRAGRAGRMGPGYCLRLWSQSEHENRPDFDPPEIKCIDLSEIYLNLAAANLKLNSLEWLDPISQDEILKAEEKLRSLGALDHNNDLTKHGEKMSKISTHPHWAHALLIAKEKNLISSISLILAMLEGRSFVQSQVLSDFFPLSHPRSDVYCTLLAFEEAVRRNFDFHECEIVGIHAGRAREVGKVAQRLSNLAECPFKLEESSYETLARSLLTCFPNQIAYLVSAGQKIYQDARGHKLHLSKHSVVGNEQFVLPLQILEKKIKGRIVLEMECVSGIDEAWIRQDLNAQISTSRQVLLDKSTRKVVRREVEGWQKLILSVRETEEVTASERAHAYAQALLKGDLKLKHWNAQVEKLLNRVSFLASVFPEFGLTEMDEATQLLFYEQLCQNGSSWKEIKNLEVYPFLFNCFSQEEKVLLNDAVPESFDLKTGKRPYSLDYSQKGEVILSAVLQDLYDVAEHPKIVYGKYPLVVEILAPSRRPVQRTSNLSGFWEGAYPQIRKELSGRYPKHEWR